MRVGAPAHDSAEQRMSAASGAESETQVDSWRVGDGRSMSIVESSSEVTSSEAKEYDSSSVLDKDKSLIDTDFSGDSEMARNVSSIQLALKEEGKLFVDKGNRRDLRSELWVQEERIRVATKGLHGQELALAKQVVASWTSDAYLSCPACFTTLCYDCKRHEREGARFLAMFVTHCRTLPPPLLPDEAAASGWEAGECAVLRRVNCSKCKTMVAVRDEEGLYHFFSALPSSA